MRSVLTASLFLISAAASAAQQPQARLRGTVVTAVAPLGGANVFLLETLEGALSDSAGHWTFTTSHTGHATLVVKAAGFNDVRRIIEVPGGESIVVVLKKATHQLAPTTVVASRYAASDERGATLTTLDVVATPGTNADVMRAIQTLPGVQNVDEGTGIYVRGGDYTETHVLLNDAVLHTAFTFESPNGTFIGTVDPFLLDGIYFSSGGFGARYGNALSGIAALNTLGRPTRRGYTGGAGLAAISASGSAALTRELGVRFAANQFDTDLLFKVNGSTQEYRTPPRGYDRSGSVIWNYRPTAEVKAFAIRQTTDLITVLEEPSYTGSYSLGIGSHLAVVNWRDVVGTWSPSLRVSDTRMRRTQDYGAFRMLTGQRYRGASGQMDWSPAGGVTLRAGAEWERSWSELDGSVPEQGDDRKPGARTTVVGSDIRGDRAAGFGELDLLVGARTRLVAGLRSDNSTLSRGRTLDPRVSAAITIVPGVVFTSAWGIYHQVPDPIFFDSTLGVPGLSSMSATHSIVGVQAGSSGQMIRLELFDKRYQDLAQVDRDFDVVNGGVGSSRGADLFVSGSGLPGMRWRVSLSSIVAKRTEPASGVLAPAPFDVTHSVTTVVNQSFGPSWHLGLSQRYATGRPFTPVTSATFDATRNVWDPQYGAPMSERLPAFRRVDLGLTHLRRIGTTNTVFYSSISNIFDRENVFLYRYTQDYTSRIPIRSMFKRSYYVGASISQ
jgi:vitamin B12 transporter